MKPEWINRAACRGMDPELFMPSIGDLDTAKRAKQVCKTCPVLKECREYGLREHKKNELMGIFGGLSATERIKILSKDPTFNNYTNLVNQVNEYGERSLKPCGTNAAYQRHKAAGEEPCQMCDIAHALWSAEKRKKRKQRQLAQDSDLTNVA